MAKYTYLHKSKRGIIEATDKLPEGNPLGTTYQDYLDGLFIPLKKKQNEFVRENPAASVKEWIEMELARPPEVPVLSIEEQKTMAVSQVEQSATNRLNELYPAHEMLAQAYSTKIDETEQAVYFDGFEAAKSTVNGLLTLAVEAINSAEETAEIDTAISLFNDQISVL